MKIMRAATAFSLGVLIGGVVAMQGAAAAHAASNYYGVPWGTDGLPVITYKFSDNFPTTGGWRARVLDAAERWSNVDPTNFSFSDLANDNPQNYSNQCPDYDYEENVIYYRSLTGAYGSTSVCPKANGNAKWFTLSLDSTDQNWYSGTGSPGNTEIDLWSVVQHELGHAAGMVTTSTTSGHFSSDADCDRDAPIDWGSWQTMCAGTAQILGYDQEEGKTFRRTLETHDNHTLDNQY